jgi:hypothetical protein
MFVEELFFLVTLQTYPCNYDSVLKHAKDMLQKLLLQANSDITMKGDMVKNAAASGSQVHTWSMSQDTWNSSGVHPQSTGGPNGLRIPNTTPLLHGHDPAVGGTD